MLFPFSRQRERKGRSLKGHATAAQNDFPWFGHRTHKEQLLLLAFAFFPKKAPFLSAPFFLEGEARTRARPIKKFLYSFFFSPREKGEGKRGK